MAAIGEMDASERAQIPTAPREFVGHLLRRWEERGHNPLSRALASPALSEEMRERVSTLAGDLLVGGEAVALRERGVREPELHAELLVAFAVGVAMTRANGTLETLAAAPREQVLAALAPLLDGLGTESG